MGLKKKIKQEVVEEREIVKAEVLDRALQYVTRKYNLDNTYMLTGFSMKAKGITIVVGNNDITCAYTITGDDIVESLITGEVDVEDLI